MSSDNLWHWWQEALAGRIGPIHDSAPQQGFYRVRDGKSGPFLPVAIWQQDGQWIALRNGKEADAAAIWTWCCRNPITEEAYYTALETGKWGDEPTSPSMGHNLPDDPHEALKIEFAGEKELAEAFLKNPIKTDEDADKAAAWSKRVAAIYNSADVLFRAKKDPIVKAGREVDEEFRWREDAKKLSSSLKAHIDPYLKEKNRLEQERQRKAREEADRIQREADAARIAAEQASAKNDNSASEAAAEAERLAQQAAAAEKETQSRNASAGRTGTKVSLRTFVFAEITDFDKLLLALKDRQEIREVVEALANRAARSGVQLAGMEIRSEQRAA